jgi:ORF6N domain
MFELTSEEYSFSRSQNGPLKQGENIKYSPMVFTEQGVAMLSSVLNSSRAIKVNIQIIRIFKRIRQMFIDNTELRLEIEKIKGKLAPATWK